MAELQVKLIDVIGAVKQKPGSKKKRKKIVNPN